MGILGNKRTIAEAPAPAGGLSIVAVGMSVRGDLDSQGTVKVEGAVDGHIRSRAQVLIARDGKVIGDIDAREAIVGGAVRGSIRADERVEIQSGATVEGDITTRRILVAEGGILNGQVRMGEAAAGTPGVAAARAGSTPAADAAPVAGLPVIARPSVPVARMAVPPRLSSPSFGP